jgi:hypothetical protein
MANLYEPEFDGSSDRDGFTYRRAKLVAQAAGRGHLSLPRPLRQ